MNSIVQEYFSRLSLESRQRMEESYSSEKDEFVRLMDLLVSMLIRFEAANPNLTKENPYQPAFGLMTKGANTLGAAFELTVNGYLWEPPALLRVALETFSVGWDIVHTPDRFEIWKAGMKFDSTLSITKAKQANPEIGKLNGLLSKMHVHINPLNSSPAMIQDNPPKIQLFGLINPGKENIRRPEIYLCLMMAYICLQLAELTFHKFSENLETIKILPESEDAIVRISHTHRKFVEKMEAAFKQLANGDIV